MYGCPSQETLQWTGPTTEEGQQALFDSLFSPADGDRCVADDYLGTPAAENAFRQKLAAQRGNFMRNDGVVPLSACISPRELKRLSAYEEVFVQKSTLGGSDASAAPGCFVSDFSQNVGERKRCGTFVPAITHSTTLFSHSRQQLFTPDDVDFSQGWPSGGNMEAYVACPSSSIGFLVFMSCCFWYGWCWFGIVFELFFMVFGASHAKQ